MSDSQAVITEYWDVAAAAFDEEPDHGLRTERTRAAWDALLRTWAPAAPSDILDAGCGTGSLSALLAAAGHRVTGVDLSPRMVDRARAKLAAAGLAGRFLVGDAGAPPTGEERFDMLLCRHVLWTLPDPEAALREWTARLRPGGTLLLVEGRWREAGQAGAPYAPGAGALPWGGGVGAAELAACLEPLVASLRIETLSDNADLWGGPVEDERYVVAARV
ncbi:class I SAM-dependent methyltransferase [Streptomyces iconiensis]|uniref:Class I SAM-dependent methyltransferase n=1 Tax=Streptomyces iconiensis TaxID=1384038 RepID=A0ABT7A6U7_9ACTN|nr:class I SAM-dependent methyltransferase [Streptomyces iconiensis]MDJ1137039.1 class I SAM-dependent methyltransferase [Streptomyces iconiensis]